MNESNNTQPSPLIDSIGQALTPCQGKPDSPVQADGGQWALEYSGKDVKQIKMNMTVTLNSPIPMNLVLYSVLNECEIQQLKHWLNNLPLEKK